MHLQPARAWQGGSRTKAAGPEGPSSPRGALSELRPRGGPAALIEERGSERADEARGHC